MSTLSSMSAMSVGLSNRGFGVRYRRRVIGPGVVPASLVDDLGGSPKCIRACRLDLRGSYRVFTLCKELGTAAAAREAYVEFMILHHTPI